MNRPSQKILLLLTAVVLLAGIFAILFHHHSDGDDSHCLVCHAIKQLAFILLAALTLWITKSKPRFAFIRVLSAPFYLFSTEQPARAPPTAFSF